MTQLRFLCRLGATLIFLALMMGRAEAASCSAVVSAINFGSVSVRTGVTNSTSGNVAITCSGGHGTIGVCVDFGPGGGGAGAGNSPRYMRRADNSALNYELRSGGNGSSYGTLTSVFVSMLVVLGNGSANVPIYADITSDSVAVGTGSYSSVFSGASNISLRFGLLSCNLAGTIVAVPNFTVSANVVPSCELNVGALDFGNIPALLNNPVAGQATIDVRCTADTTYRVDLGLGSGTGATGPTDRRMMNGLATLIYGLYQDAAHGQPWGNTVGNSRSGTGAGGSQTLTVYGQIAAGQTTRTGTYSDSVVVTLTY